MSTAFTVTASAVRDLTLGDELEIVNCISVLAATQGDGTLFHLNSFQEEDLVKLCIGLGQVHQEGVLWLSYTETVLTFCSGSEMMATVPPYMVAMSLHDEPIQICVHQPTGTQGREYVALRGRCPSGTQVQIQGGEVSQSSPSEPQGPQPQLHMAIRGLDDAQLREALEELLLEMPLGSPVGQW